MAKLENCRGGWITVGNEHALDPVVNSEFCQLTQAPCPATPTLHRRRAVRIFLASVDAVFPGANEDETEEKNHHLSRAGPFKKLTSCLIKEDRCHNEI